MWIFLTNKGKKVKKGLGGINMVELQKNRSVFIDGSREVQVNIIIEFIRSIRESSLRGRLRRRGRILEMLQSFCDRSKLLISWLSLTR